MSREITKDQVKRWVVLHSKVNNPYKLKWTAAVTLGFDYYGEGKTIESAYNHLAEKLFDNPSALSVLQGTRSFISILN